MSDELTPITRKETFLAKAGGQNVVTPTPITREETFLQAIIDNGSGGGGGTGGGALIVHVDDNTGTTLDKTWQEIKNAYDAGSVVMLQFGDGSEYGTDYLHKIESVKGVFGVRFGEFGTLETYLYVTDNANGYPVYSE